MLRRTLALVLLGAVLAALLPVAGCAAPDRLFEAFWETILAHDHNRVRLIDRQGLGWLAILYLLAEGPPLPDASALEVASLDAADDPATLAQAALPPRSLRLEPTAAAPFFDHELDGLWHGRTTVNVRNASGKTPFLLLANAAAGHLYLAVVFQDMNECVRHGRADWTALYTDKVELDPATGRLRFEKISSGWLAPFVPDIADLDFSFRATPRANYFTGQGKATWAGRSQTAFSTRDEFFKVTGSGGVHGLWSTGFTARVYAGEFLEPPIFHPTVLSLVDRGGIDDMDLHVLWNTQEAITANARAKTLAFDFWTPNGVVDGELDLVGKKLVGRVWDPLLGEYMDLTFVPAGTSGATPKVKRAKPRTAALAAPGQRTTLTVIGRNFVPGSMVFFDRPEIRLESIEFLSAKKLKVKVAAAGAIPAGTTVGIMVLNPDNRSGEKTRGFVTR